MSQSQMQEITCPKCGKKQFSVCGTVSIRWKILRLRKRSGMMKPFLFIAWTAVRLLRCIIISSTMNRRKAFIVCSADGSDYTAMKETLTAEDNAFKGYTKRIVLSHNEFKEKLLIFDAGFNDKIVEVMKSGIYAKVEAHYKDKGIDEIFLPPTKRESMDSFSADMEKCWRRWNLTKPCMTRSWKRHWKP